MEGPLKRWQCNVHNGTVHERERRTQGRDQQDGSANRFRTGMVVGIEIGSFGTRNRLRDENRIRVVHGLLLLVDLGIDIPNGLCVKISFDFMRSNAQFDH
jgi:hypothetical protein